MPTRMKPDPEPKTSRTRAETEPKLKMEDFVKKEDIMVDQEAGSDDEAAMKQMMGFAGFGSTKGKKIPGNDAGAVRKEKKTEYRQYMNRHGGFNRPLSPTR